MFFLLCFLPFCLFLKIWHNSRMEEMKKIVWLYFFTNDLLKTVVTASCTRQMFIHMVQFFLLLVFCTRGGGEGDRLWVNMSKICKVRIQEHRRRQDRSRSCNEEFPCEASNCTEFSWHPGHTDTESSEKPFSSPRNYRSCQQLNRKSCLDWKFTLYLLGSLTEQR